MISTKEKDISKTKVEIIKEAKRIEEACLYSSKGHFAASSFWNKFHLYIGVPTVILSAIVGTAFIAQIDKYKVIAGVISLLVAALTALITFLNPNEKADKHLSSGNYYDSLQNKVRIFWTIDCNSTEDNEILTGKLKDYSEQKDRINQTSPQIPWFAYNTAKKGIERGEAEYSVDNQPSNNSL